MRLTIPCIAVLAFVVATGCGKKKGKPSADDRKATTARPGDRAGPPSRPRVEPPPSRPRTEPPRPPAPDARPPGPPPKEAKIPQAQKIPHSECNITYRAGSKNFRLKNFEGAVAEFVRFVSGRCWGRITRSTEAWMAYRAFQSTCKTKDQKYQHAFKALLVKACGKWGGDRPPCDKAKRCPAAKTTDRFKCRELYKKGTDAAKANDNQTAYDAFVEFNHAGCFGALSRTSDQWAAYRAIKAADALSKPKEEFVARLKTACAVKPNWACKKGLAQ
jgi:hypothetical protein